MAETLMETATTTNDGEQTSTETENAAGGEQSQTEGQQQTEEQNTETKPEGAPETYEFKAPEGQEFDPEFLKAFSETAKELNLTQDNAQKLIDKVSPVIQQQQTARIEAIRTEWAESSKVDKEFGGDKLNENLGVAKQALDKFGTPELKELINASGLGNHPEMIRFFYRTGKALAPDTFVGGHKEGKAAPKSFNDFADKLYS